VSRRATRRRCSGSGRCSPPAAATRAPAMQMANEALRASEEADVRWHWLEALRARGMAELLSGDAAGAVASFGQVWRHLRTEGVENPGAFPLGPDHVQALVASGSVEQAAEVAAALSQAAEDQDHPWGRAASARADGWVMLGRGDAELAADRFAESAKRFQALELPFDAARSLGALGIAQRRARRKREARASLERAARTLEALGSPGWAKPLRAELRSLGGRPPSAPSELTATERRVAELVAQGLTNKEVAASLVVTVRAVEAHLTRIYAKLGVRSRAELARAYQA
jgi:DNA-binding CsgD family transcriptional regulator